jgi:putative ABC transport system permease protein
VTLARISLAYLRRRLLGTVLNVVLLAIAVAAVTLLLLITEQVEDRVEREAHGIDLVVGAKGSRAQLVLSTLYELDVPGEDMGWSDFQRIVAQRGVGTAIPLALGDHLQRMRIVGTTHDYPRHYGATVTDGRWWERPFEAVLGADVHAHLRVALGSTFVPTHGVPGADAEAHAEHAYRVVGVMRRTGTLVDRLILTDVASYWTTHPERRSPQEELVAEPPDDPERPITAVLIRYAPGGDMGELAGFLASQGHLQAVSPARETARLLGIVAVNAQLLRGFAALLLVSAALSIFLALYHGVNERRYDIAVMRTLGATPADVMSLLLFEGVLLALCGALSGLALGHVLTSVLGFALRRFEQMSVTGWTWYGTELWIVVAAVAVGALSALVPAWRAHEVDIATTLARG